MDFPIFTASGWLIIMLVIVSFGLMIYNYPYFIMFGLLMLLFTYMLHYLFDNFKVAVD